MHARTASTSHLPITSDADLAWIRQHVRQAAAEAGFNLVQQTKLVTATSELARNTLVHGGGGHMESTLLREGVARGLRLSFVDSGPGIRDPELAMTDGYSTGGGLGMGLSGAKRLVQEFTLESRPGQGTTVTITDWVSGVPAPRTGAS
ncbi:anti-sigma regulatory factor [Streptomyces sp. NPDC059690]|uniref:anti-sigma regulatory factor n=1 Tax=Streptomyces sp. NPDC059690 TaxID=3346907 RepID=UPI0036C244C0